MKLFGKSKSGSRHAGHLRTCPGCGCDLTGRHWQNCPRCQQEIPRSPGCSGCGGCGS